MGIELERTVDSIQVGTRHRTDLGDIDALAASIREHGLLQPITVTIDGVLVCGRRRLAAIRQLGWRTVSVWVRSGISDRLGLLLAEQDENVHRKPLTQLEAAALYRELKQLMAEDAERRDAATRFSSENQPGSDGGAKLAPPSLGPAGKTRAQAARMVTGRASYTTLERIGKIEQIAQDPNLPEQVREQAREGLAALDAGNPVMPIFERVTAAITQADTNRQSELHALAEEAVARVTGPGRGKKRTTPATETARAPGRWPVAAFVQTWTSLADWWTHYDPDELAAELTDDQARVFLTVVDGTVAFADRLRPLLTIDPTEADEAGDDAAGKEPVQQGVVDEGAVPRRHLRAL
ncbi:ParB N-terminal domain-containing protein [Brachybacterium alimentarium]|uniref:ParB N-terminal domain-containing protein n=1 Tax=Brachybacterium alimentarium TaxID=47845 RepID=UPI000DF29E19|nr:ParB N-terminal domain-containing protein [Brachybacterium alimentarium]RCS82624.1 chromosome partitioning protein ParB [Brachybacterium alimentarium]